MSNGRILLRILGKVEVDDRLLRSPRLVQVLEPERMPASSVPESAVTRAIEESTQLEQEHKSRTMHHLRLELYCVGVGIVIVEYCTAAGDPTLSLQVRHGLKPCALHISNPVSFVQYHSMEYHAK